jgi:UDPglucose 6-dehydrogenase
MKFYITNLNAYFLLIKMTSVFNLGIIGGGFVGQAAKIFGHRSSVNCKVYDIDPSKCHPEGTSLEDLKDCDLIFICLPTPMNPETGECYTGLIEKCLCKVRETLGENIDIVIRSTVPVGFSQKHKCHFMPEFLTEKNWKEDTMNCKEWFIGVDDNSNNVINKFCKLFDTSFPGVVLSIVNTSTAEAIKYFRNCFLATKVSFCNEFETFCKVKNINYDIVRGYGTNDPRIGSSHSNVPGHDGKRGFGGTCFPKDMASLEFQMKEAGVESKIISAANERNYSIDRKEQDWNLDKGRAVI